MKSVTIGGWLNLSKIELMSFMDEPLQEISTDSITIWKITLLDGSI
jgi:hypothetical protein